ncbi:MAG: ATP-binding protein [Solirubrobacteraceae bacterium]
MSRFDRCLVPDAKRCDLADLVFIDAFGLVATASCIVAAAKAGGIPQVVLPTAPQMREHLTAMGFMNFLRDIGQEEGVGAEPSSKGDVVVPLARVATVFEAEQLSRLLWANAARWDAQVLETLTEGLWELVANALEHSGAHALLMGQVYLHGEPPDHHQRVQIAIGDAGRGIRASFLESGTQSPANDVEAIALALRYLVSSVPDPGRGQGLTTTVEQVTALEGHVVLRSGAARVTVDQSGAQAQHVEPIGGTVVGISLPLYPGSS